MTLGNKSDINKCLKLQIEKADGSFYDSLVVPIVLAITCIMFVSYHQLLNKLLCV